MKKNSLKLELYKLNELPGSWTMEEDEESLRTSVEELRKSDREILKKYPPSRMAALIASRMKQTDSPAEERENLIPFSRKITARVLIPAAAILAIALILPITFNSRNNPSLELTRVKGAEEPRLNVYKRTGNESELMTSDSPADQHDLLQLTYRVSSPAFGLIISIDGRGVVTRHYPETEDQSPRLATGGEQFLPFSYELDDAPEFETFYLLTSEKPFSTEEIMDITASAAVKGDYILDIPELIKKNTKSITGKIRQYAVPIRKDGNHENKK